MSISQPLCWKGGRQVPSRTHLFWPHTSLGVAGFTTAGTCVATAAWRRRTAAPPTLRTSAPASSPRPEVTTTT
eukprot:15466065-Alexandrium_andersonii.AAC.1